MANIDLTNITPPRVPLTDSRTGLISREWYRFFLNLFILTGEGRNTTSLTDLQLGPPVPQQEDFVEFIVDVNGLLAQPALGTSELQAALDVVRQELQTLPPKAVEELQQQLITLRQEVQTQRQPDLGSFAALQQDNLPWTIFDTTPEHVPTAIGTVAWDGGTTLGIQMTANVLQRVGEAEYVYAKASSAITKGQLCYHTGSVGSSGTITAAPTPIGLTDPNQIVGVAAESIALNDFGLIQISGDLRGFNTTGSSVGETWADGDPLYYNPAYVGSMTKVKPVAPNQKTYIGEVVNAGSGGSGSMHVRIVQGSILGGTDSNVQFGTVNNGDLIQYDSVLGYWKNVPASTLPVGTATNIAGGAAGSVPYQTAPGTTTFLPIGTALQVLKVNAGATAPEWVSGAALTKTDDTNVTLTLGGTPATSLLAATSLTLGWTGQLAVSRGGTGVSTTPANGQLLIGNGTGYTVANLTQGTGVTITNSAGGISISATGTGGTVTSVGLSMPSQFAVTNSPVTSSGTLTAAWNTQTANYVLAGPTTGAAAAPTFRALVAADIPSLSYVTSVGATAPITSTGGLTPTIGVTAAALTKTDDTNVTLTLGGSPTTALLAATSLTLGWTGQLAVGRGGTGIASYAVGDLLYASGTTTLSKLAVGTAYYQLGVNAGGTAPAWQPSATSVLTTQGDLLYASAANTLARLGKSTTATRYLANTGSSNNPQWDQVNLTNGVTGTLPTGNGGTGLTSFNSSGLVWASNTTTLATTTAITVNGGGTGLYFSSANLSGNFWQARYNSSNVPMSVATGNANGFPFLGVNVNGAAGSDNGTFDINGWAGRIRLDNGVFQAQISSASGTAGNAITWTTVIQTDTGLAFKPGADNTQTLGTGALRWSTVYAGTGTINTSDARYKEQIKDLDDAERRVAQRIKKLVKKFKFRDSVAKKGDKARFHVGVVAQEVMAAFEAESLDPCQYALFCYDEWDDQFEPVKASRTFIDENGEEQTELVETGEMQQTQVAGSRFGIRYDQLLAFVLAAL